MGCPGGFRHGGALGVALLALGVACAGRSVSEGAGGTGGTSGTSGAGAQGGSNASGGTSAGGTTAGGTTAGGTGGTGGAQPPDYATCGNGVHDELEECDDGNLIFGDGCALCLVERDAVCPVVGPCVLDVCGSGRVTRAEACDDGNARGDDGCSADCSAVEPGWLCPGEGLPCRPLCGDAKLVGAEECDDGNELGGDGCSRACRIERPLCAMDLPVEAGAAGAPSEGEPPADDAGARIACLTPVCGDGVVTAPEDCDDGANGNDSTYGGCSTDCSYAEFCGDGIVNEPEECDSGTANAVSYGTMGCTQSCHFAPYCGDGSIETEFGEECDNGVRNGTRSCRANCTIDLR